MRLHTKLMLSYAVLIAAVVLSVEFSLTRSLRGDLNDRTRQIVVFASLFGLGLAVVLSYATSRWISAPKR